MFHERNRKLLCSNRLFLFRVKQAAYVFHDTIRRYCKNMSGLEALVPIGIEVLEHLKSDDLPNREDLMGMYLN